MRLVYPATFRRRHFDPEDAPDERTIRSWVRAGHLPGREVAGKVFVDEDAWLASTGDALADRVLAEQ